MSVCWVVILVRRTVNQWKLWIVVMTYPYLTHYKLCWGWMLYGIRLVLYMANVQKLHACDC